MKDARNNEIARRRAASADAKAALLNAYRSATAAARPGRSARQAERAAIATAREERRLERERVKHENLRLIETEAAALQAAVQAAVVDEAATREAADKARIERVIEDDAARKAERDRRYANRKARQG